MKYCLTMGNQSFSRYLHVKLANEQTLHQTVKTFIYYFFCFASTSFVILRFSVRVAGEQFEIKPPHFTVFHRIHHFAWVKFQMILSHILNVIVPSSSKLSNWSSPICFGKLSLFGESFLRHFAYMAKPSKAETF